MTNCFLDGCGFFPNSEFQVSDFKFLILSFLYLYEKWAYFKFILDVKVITITILHVVAFKNPRNLKNFLPTNQWQTYFQEIMKA